MQALRVLVLQDEELADELLALVESRGGTVQGFADEESLLHAAIKVAPQVVVVAASLGAPAAYTMVKRLESIPACEGSRVVLVAPEDRSVPGGDFMVVSRSEVFATVGALLRFDPALRVPVHILARYELLGHEGDQKRLGNVLELGVASLLFDADHMLPDVASILVSFVVPGTTFRLKLLGALEGKQQASSSRIVRLDGLEPPSRRALRSFIEKRLVRVPSEVT